VLACILPFPKFIQQAKRIYYAPFILPSVACPSLPYISTLYNKLEGVSGVAQEEKLRKQIFEITWRDKRLDRLDVICTIAIP
jgi:hypothetical protein